MIIKKEYIFDILRNNPDNTEIVEKHGGGIFEKVANSYYVALREELENVSNFQIEIVEIGRFQIRRRKVNQKIQKLIVRKRILRDKVFKTEGKKEQIFKDLDKELRILLRVRSIMAEIIKYGKINIKRKHSK